MGLDKIRQEIDQIDTQMKELFLARMELSHQVVEEKKKTGGSIYVPAREAEIIQRRSEGVEEEKLPEYQMLIKQIMGISRTYQYSQIADGAEELANLPTGEGTVTVEVFEKKGEVRLVTMLDAIVLAGLSIEQLSETDKTENGVTYQLTVAGDFSKSLAKGAMLQICSEMESVRFA